MLLLGTVSKSQTTLLPRMAVFWMMRPLVWYKRTDVSEILAVSIIRAMLAASTSETSVNFYQTTGRNIPEESHLHTDLCYNLRSQQSTELWIRQSKIQKNSVSTDKAILTTSSDHRQHKSCMKQIELALYLLPLTAHTEDFTVFLGPSIRMPTVSSAITPLHLSELINCVT
jgi:hypothetical protein